MIYLVVMVDSGAGLTVKKGKRSRRKLNGRMIEQRLKAENTG